jgi:nucleoside-diphosphate-sugar epimerase
LSTLFLTGGTGFVGSHTARRFLSEGWRVKALVRRPERPGLLPSEAEIVAGDLLAEKTYVRAMEGCDAVVHAAGVTKARALEDYLRTNALGTASAARAAASACSGAKFVLVSSQAAAGPSLGRPVEESDAAHPVSWYGKSKLEGERAVAESFRGPWTVVRPCVVYGPGDAGLFPLFALAARGWAPILAGGRRQIQLIAAQDLARVLVAAAGRKDLSGRKGFAASETVTLGELAREIGSFRSPPARALSVPATVLRLAGLAESLREFVTRRSRPFNRDKAREVLAGDWTCDAAPFLSELGVSNLTPWTSGLLETWRWYVREGWLTAGFGEL